MLRTHLLFGIVLLLLILCDYSIYADEPINRSSYSSYVVRSKYLFSLSDDSPALNDFTYDMCRVVGVANTIAVAGGPIMLLGESWSYPSSLNRAVYFVDSKELDICNESRNIADIIKDSPSATAVRLLNYEGYDPLTQEYGNPKGMPTSITLSGDVDVVIVPDIELGCYYLLVVDYPGEQNMRIHNNFCDPENHVYHSEREIGKYMVNVVESELEMVDIDHTVTGKLKSVVPSTGTGHFECNYDSILVMLSVVLFIMFIVQTIRNVIITRKCDRANASSENNDDI